MLDAMLEHLASFSVRHRRLVVVTWLLVIVAATVAAGAWGGDDAQGGRLRGTDSDAAYQLYLDHFPDDPAGSALMVFEDPRGLDAASDSIDSFVGDLRSLPGVLDVTSPFTDGQRSADGTVGTAEVTFDIDRVEVIDDIVAAADTLRAEGTSVDFSSGWFQEGGVPATEGFGLLAAMVILLIAFGSVVAMGLPVVTAVVGIAIGLAGVELWSAVVPTPDFTVQVASMVGIGVGIDYALFIVTRYREALRRRGPERSPGHVHDAVVEAIDTAGRAVLFAGVTVMISLMGMFLMGLSFLYGLAVGTSTAVLVAVLAALTLLPALLATVGYRLDRLSIHRRAERVRESGWHRWSRLVQRHPAGFAIGGLVVLLALSAPTLAMRQATADLGNDAPGTTTRAAYDRISAAFGPGENGPLLLVAPTPDQAAFDRLAALGGSLATIDGVARVGQPVASPDGLAAVLQVIPTTGPQDEATAQLVHDLRVGPLADERAAGTTVHVGGSTAGDVDFADRMSARLPVFIGAVLALSFVLLMAVFRSVLVPLKAVALNLLSIGSAYGVLVMVFQWGWLGRWIGIDGGAPIEPWAPMMLFAIVFGLSMDYEVFLLSSVKERFDAGMPNSTAVVEGLASTARVITAAAAIMVCVFGSFVLGDLRAIKLIGLGLSVAVLIDATVVRMVLVPATMELLGDRNWWLPRPLARLLPRLDVEGRHSHTVAPALTAVSHTGELAEVR
jgi:putative drug exporter of the RND superfamily